MKERIRLLFPSFVPSVYLVRAPVCGALSALIGVVCFEFGWALSLLIVSFPMHVMIAVSSLFFLLGYVATAILAFHGEPPDPDHYTSTRRDIEKAKEKKE